MSNAEWLNNMYQAGIRSGLTDLQARVMASQAALESGWGKSGLTRKGNNYFGMKAGKSWTGPTITMPTKEQAADGSWYTENAKFRAYNSPEESFADKSAMMRRNWPDAMNAQTWDDAMAGLRNGRYGAYATDQAYASKLASINRRINPSAAVQSVAPVQQVAAAPVQQVAATPVAAQQGLGALAPQAAQATAALPTVTAANSGLAAAAQNVAATQAATAAAAAPAAAANPFGGLFGLMLQAKMSQAAAAPTHTDMTVPRPKMVDNRSDEEKMAAVSQTPNVYMDRMRRRARHGRMV